MTELKMAIVKWVDSTYYRIDDTLVQDFPSMSKPRTLISVGILLYEDEDFIAICQDVEATGSGSRLVLSIPKVCVTHTEIFTKKIPSKKEVV